MQSPFCHSLNNTLHILPCPIIISCRDKILIIVSHLNLRKNVAFQYHYISLLLFDILCPFDSRLNSVKCALVLFYSITFFNFLPNHHIAHYLFANFNTLSKSSFYICIILFQYFTNVLIILPPPPYCLYPTPIQPLYLQQISEFPKLFCTFSHGFYQSLSIHPQPPPPHVSTPYIIIRDSHTIS
jgi:hypothetical protein